MTKQKQIMSRRGIPDILGKGVGVFLELGHHQLLVFMVERLGFVECILRLKVKWKLSLLLDLVGSNQDI